MSAGGRSFTGAVVAGEGVEGPLSFLGGAGRARWLVGPLLWNNGVGFPAMNEAGGGGVSEGGGRW